MEHKGLLIHAAKALKAMLEDYRTDGCPDPGCRVCRESKAGEKMARAALNTLSAHIGPLKEPIL